MNADEPRIAKYGMPASESQHYEAAQTAIAYEKAVLKELRFAHALRVGPSLRLALDALAGEGAAPAPIAQEVPIASASAPAPAPLPRVARRASPDGLRERLGLR